MSIIPAIIYPSAVMEKGEEPYHNHVRASSFGKDKPVAFNASPVVRAMDRVTRHMNLRDHVFPEAFKVDVHRQNVLSGLTVRSELRHRLAWLLPPASGAGDMTTAAVTSTAQV